MSGVRRALALVALALLAGCASVRPYDGEQPGVTTQGSGGSAGPTRGRVGLRLPFPP